MHKYNTGFSFNVSEIINKEKIGNFLSYKVQLKKDSSSALLLLLSNAEYPN